MKKILTVSLVAMMAVSTARADIASTAYVQGAVEAEAALRSSADNAINAKIGTVAEGTTVVKMIEDAKSAAIEGATYDDSGVKQLIQGNTNAITAINNTTTGILAQAKNYTGEEIKKLDKTDTAVTGQVVSAVSETDGVITVSRRALVEGDIPTISQSKVNGLADALDAKADKEKMVTVGAGEAFANEQMKTSKEMYPSMATTSKMISDANSAIEQQLNNITNADEGILAQAEGKINQLAEGAVKDNTNAITAINNTTTGILAQAKNYTGEEIKKLDKTDTAVTGQVVSAVSETDGVITVSRRALVEGDIPTISQSKVNGLANALTEATAAALADLADATEDTANKGVYTLTMVTLGDEATFKWEKIAR